MWHDKLYIKKNARKSEKYEGAVVVGNGPLPVAGIRNSIKHLE